MSTSPLKMSLLLSLPTICHTFQKSWRFWNHQIRFWINDSSIFTHILTILSCPSSKKNCEVNCNEIQEHIADCSRKVCKIESGSWQMWLGWRGDRWLFTRGRFLRMIVCKRPVAPDHHLQEAGPSGWSFARVMPLQNNNNNNKSGKRGGHQGYRGNGTEGGEGGKERRRRRNSRRKNCRGRDGIEPSTRGPRGPNKDKIIFCNKSGCPLAF